MRSKAEQGFILPLAVLLVIILTISGTAFMQHDYLERRMAMNNVDNHGAFYLANAGIERAREVLKINTDTSATATWTPVLASLTNDSNRVNNPLCPIDPAWKCVILPFGDPVLPPGIPFEGTFDDGQYEVRAFNDNAPGETGTIDTNGLLTIRARGTVRGEQKVIEVTIQAVSAGNLINCATGTNCPNKISGNANTIDPMEGRDPAVGPIPLLDKQDRGFYPLTDARNYYRDATGTKYAANFPTLVSDHQVVVPPSSGKFTPTETKTYYFVQGNVTLVQAVKNVALSNVVIFSTGTITIPGDMILTNAILVGVTGVTLESGPMLSAPYCCKTDGSLFPNDPLIISGSNVTQGGNQSGGLTGNVYAVGTVKLNPNTFEGVVFGNNVEVKGSSLYTDQEKLRYYDFMPGFYYPDELKTTVVLAGAWRELQ